MITVCVYNLIAQNMLILFLTCPVPYEQNVYRVGHNIRKSILIGVFHFNTGDCVNGDIRLAKGRTEAYQEGTVEMCSEGQWLTVCGDVWTAKNSMVACRNLGFNDAPGCTFSKYYSEIDIFAREVKPFFVL